MDLKICNWNPHEQVHFGADHSLPYTIWAMTNNCQIMICFEWYILPKIQSTIIDKFKKKKSLKFVRV